MLQSGELMQIFNGLLVHAEDALRDLQQIEESAITAPGKDVARQAAIAGERLAVAVKLAKARVQLS